MKRKIEELKNVLIWFRSDLRLHDNTALMEAVRLSEIKEAKLHAVYVFALDELRLQNIGFVRIDFVRRSLEKLQKSLADIGDVYKRQPKGLFEKNQQGVIAGINGSIFQRFHRCV